MELAKKNKLMILFTSLENPLWKHSFQYRPNPKGDRLKGKKTLENILFDEVFDTAPQTIANWRVGKVISAKQADHLFATAIKTVTAWGEKVQKSDESEKNVRKTPEDLLKSPEIVRKIQEFKSDFDKAIDPPPKDAKPVYDVAKGLDLKTTAGQLIIDQAIYTHLPLLQSVYFDTSTEGELAGATFQELGGHYYAWMRRDNGWMQCPLRGPISCENKKLLFPSYQTQCANCTLSHNRSGRFAKARPGLAALGI